MDIHSGPAGVARYSATWGGAVIFNIPILESKPGANRGKHLRSTAEGGGIMIRAREKNVGKMPYSPTILQEETRGSKKDQKNSLQNITIHKLRMFFERRVGSNVCSKN